MKKHLPHLASACILFFFGLSQSPLQAYPIEELMGFWESNHFHKGSPLFFEIRKNGLILTYYKDSTGQCVNENEYMALIEPEKLKKGRFSISKRKVKGGRIPQTQRYAIETNNDSTFIVRNVSEAYHAIFGEKKLILNRTDKQRCVEGLSFKKEFLEDKELSWYLLTLFLSYTVYIFGAFVVVWKNFRNKAFRLSFLFKFISLTLLMLGLYYGSAYSLEYSVVDIHPIRNGKINDHFNPFPFTTTDRTLGMGKETNDFWTNLTLLMALMTLPATAWNTWRKLIARKNLAHLVIRGINGLVGVSLLFMATGFTISSLISPYGMTSWLLMLACYAGILYVMKSTFWGAIKESGENIIDVQGKAIDWLLKIT